MYIWLWHFFRGFVTISVTGFSVERFINLAVHRGIYVWDVCRMADGAQMKVSVRGFKLLKNCARKTQCRIRIVHKHGFPFLLHRYRKRKILMGGVIFFVLTLYGLSMFVWRIDVQGQERLSREAILLFCETQGLKIGAFKYALDHKTLQRALMENFNDISWVDVHTKGTRTVILLAEIIPKQAVIDRETPCHITAAKDGLITGIVTGTGKPLVKRGDIVRAGDILVSGLLEMQSDEFGVLTVPIHAYAEVWARMYTQIRFTVPLTYAEKVYSGRVQKRYTLQLLLGGTRDINLFHSSIPFDSYDKMTHRSQPGVSGDYPLPFIWITEEYRAFETVTHTRTPDEAKELADRMVTGRIIREFDFQTDIVDKQLTFEETPEGLAVYALITTNERIDQATPITPPETPEEADEGD